MSNVKNAVLLLVLLGGLYLGYQYVNHRDVPPPPEAQLQMEQGIAPPVIEFAGSSGPSTQNEAPVPLTANTAENAAPSPLEVPPLTVVPAAEPPKPSYSANPRPTLPTTTETPVAISGSEAAPAEATNTATENSVYGQPRPNTKPSATDDLPNLQKNPFYKPSVKAPSNYGAPAPEASGSENTTLNEAATREVERATFQISWSKARDMVEKRQYADALAELTAHLDDERLTSAERGQLQKTLDALAGRVIYSTEHCLEEPYVTRSGETLLDVATKCEVPPQLLQNINGIRDPAQLAAGTELKIVRGPFRAEIDQTQRKLILFVDRYYAGEFPITLGSDQLPSLGKYTIRDKRESGASANYWLDLGNNFSIHAGAEASGASTPGCIMLTPADAADVFGILSLNSTVTVR